MCLDMEFSKITTYMNANRGPRDIRYGSGWICQQNDSTRETIAGFAIGIVAEFAYPPGRKLGRTCHACGCGEWDLEPLKKNKPPIRGEWGV